MSASKTGNSKVDLHIHSALSDGNHSPEEIVRLAADQGLKAISITDHDRLLEREVIDGLSEKYGVEIVPGAEFSAALNGRDIHILCYYPDYDNVRLREFLKLHKFARIKRVEEITKKLNRVGVRISLEKAKLRAKRGVLGRPHLADLLIEDGYVQDHNEAYRRYLGREAPAYVLSNDASCAEILELIKGSGGIALMAHPGLGYTADEVREMIDLGVDGIEVYHPRHTAEQVEMFSRIADEHSLLKSGGSDHHGKRHWLTTIGSPEVPYEVLENIKAASGVK